MNVRVYLGFLISIFAHLVEVGPVCADGQLHLVPASSGGSRRVPHGQTHGAVVLLDVDVQMSRPAALSTRNIELKYDAVCVVLFELRSEE